MRRTLQPTLSSGFRLILLALVVLALLSVFPAVAQEATETPENPLTQALYIPMRDGVQIAIDVYLPDNYQDGDHLPTLMQITRYWRGYQNIDTREVSPEVGAWLEAGYAFVRMDTRGSGASSGTRPIEWSADEVADMGEVVDWIIAQPWSNGRVGAQGVSYEGNTAELITANQHPAVRAVIPQFNDFDPLLNLALPGGVFTDNFIHDWSDVVAALDANNVCALEPETPCEMIKQITTGVKPVDADPNGEQLAAFVKEHEQNVNVYEHMSQINFRDDAFGLNGETFASVSPYALREKIEGSNTPMFIWVSWLDAATVEGALSRYLTFSNPQQVIIGAWSHGGGEHTDPFLPAATPTEPSPEEQWAMQYEFLQRHLVEAEEPQRGIRYYTMNAGTWRETETWPPEGLENQNWYFAADGSLTTAAPTADTGANSYTVDFTTTSGPTTRWHTQLGGGDVIYPDRAEEDTKLLTYTSAPLEADIEITGSPIITFYVASTATDGAFHVYLEDVAPDGTVTYITEGVFRAMHRKISAEQPPYHVSGPYHTYLKKDAAPLVPGEVAEISFNLYATSVRLETGHQIRVALAGADAGLFQRYPADGTPVWTVERNTVYPSHIELPVKLWEEPAP